MRCTWTKSLLKSSIFRKYIRVNLSLSLNSQSSYLYYYIHNIICIQLTLIIKQSLNIGYLGWYCICIYRYAFGGQILRGLIGTSHTNSRQQVFQVYVFIGHKNGWRCFACISASGGYQLLICRPFSLVCMLVLKLNEVTFMLKEPNYH